MENYEYSRVRQLTEETTLTDEHVVQVDLDSYLTNPSKKTKLSTLYAYIKSKLDSVYQAILVSGTNIKTINGDSILGSGDLVVGGTNTNIATNNLLFTQSSTTDFAGYQGTFDNAELKIVADANLNADIPFQVTQSDGRTKIFDIRGTGDVNIPSENIVINANDRSISQPTLTMRGTGASRINLANNTNLGLGLFANSGQAQILHTSGFIQYTLRNGLTPDGNVELDGVTFAYDNATNDFLIKFKKADGTVITKTIV